MENEKYVQEALQRIHGIKLSLSPSGQVINDSTGQPASHQDINDIITIYLHDAVKRSIF